jgi:hypothetical protein
MEVLRPGSCLVKAQPQGQTHIQLRMVRKLQKADVRRPPPHLFLRGQQGIGIEIVDLVQNYNVSASELLVEQKAGGLGRRGGS